MFVRAWGLMQITPFPLQPNKNTKNPNRKTLISDNVLQLKLKL